MNAQELISIIDQNPWQTMGQLIKLASPKVGKGIKDPDIFIKSLVKEVREQLQTTGQKRGTRYALIGAPAYVEPTIDDETISSVLAAVVAGKSTSAEIEKHSKVARDTVRESLRILIERDQVERTGGTRSTQYWPAGKAPAKVSGPATKVEAPERLKPPPSVGTPAYERGVAKAAAIREAQALEAPSEQPQVVQVSEQVDPNEIVSHPAKRLSIMEAAHDVLAELPRRKVLAGKVERNVFTTGELANRVTERYGYPRHRTGEAIIAAIRERKTIIHHQTRYTDSGWGVFIWRPSDDLEPLPPTYQDPKEGASLVTMPEPDDAEDAPKAKRGRKGGKSAKKVARKGRVKKR